jgi:hypothetical protein
MAGITYFVALPFDVADGSVIVGEPIECPSPAAAIERAQGLWKILGHTGAVAFSRTGDRQPAISAMRPCCEGSATCLVISVRCDFLDNELPAQPIDAIGVKSLCWGFKLQGLTWSFV